MSDRHSNLTVGSIVFGPPAAAPQSELAKILCTAIANRDASRAVEQALEASEHRRIKVCSDTGNDPGPDVLADEVLRLRAELAATRRELQERQTEVDAKTAETENLRRLLRTANAREQALEARLPRIDR